MRPIESTVDRDLLCVLALVLAFGGGCNEPVPVATTVTISPVAAVLEDAGDTVQLTATVRDQNGQAMRFVPFAWTVGDSIIAPVSQDGVVTGGAAGKTTVRAWAQDLMGETTILVEPGPGAVLHKMYREMGGDRWWADHNWKTGAPLGTWHGVGADTLGIFRLRLSGNGLTGTIPPEVGLLETLEFLELDNNRVTGSIPPELGNLEDLTELILSSNELTGSIPPELGNLEGLSWLILSDNELTGPIPPELGNLKHLSGLNLSSNELTGRIPPELGIGFLDLSWLNLSDNELTGSIPPELGNLKHLSGLNLSDNELTGRIPPELGFLEDLTELILSDNELTGSVPPELGNLRYLRQLDLSGNPLTGSLPRELIGLPLRVFHWHDTDLCAPADPAFQEWLESIGDHSGNRDCASWNPLTRPPA